MGSDLTGLRLVPRLPRFNSRSRMGSDLSDGGDDGDGEVSIHAPAWGATRLAAWLKVSEEVSIHAPAWGATRRPQAGEEGQEGFNSRSRMGSDWSPITRRNSAKSFNSRSRMGSDPRCVSSRSSATSFQFTLPHGERLAVGGGELDLLVVSIHAPAWGATRRRGRWGRRRGFNSRSRMGSDGRQRRGNRAY